MWAISWLAEKLLVPEDSAAWSYLFIHLVAEKQRYILLAELVGLVGLTSLIRFVSWERWVGRERELLYRRVARLPLPFFWCGQHESEEVRSVLSNKGQKTFIYYLIVKCGIFKDYLEVLCLKQRIFLTILNSDSCVRLIQHLYKMENNKKSHVERAGRRTFRLNTW